MVNLRSFLMIYTFIMLPLKIRELEANEMSTLKSIWCILNYFFIYVVIFVCFLFCFFVGGCFIRMFVLVFNLLGGGGEEWVYSLEYQLVVFLFSILKICII